MIKYLIFETLGLAVTASIIVWYNMKRKNKDLKENKANPKELETGEFGIKKPEDIFLTGVDCNKIIENPKFKETENEH